MQDIGGRHKKRVHKVLCENYGALWKSIYNEKTDGRRTTKMDKKYNNARFQSMLEVKTVVNYIGTLSQKCKGTVIKLKGWVVAIKFW